MQEYMYTIIHGYKDIQENMDTSIQENFLGISWGEIPEKFPGIYRK